ncbi:Spermidine/putrescine import ABC transporter permease protein PotB (TC 3.A.1.11.1) [hydrothermal vent metagenome]|uniref:Spermidine/putrescine import ABC transporter permease protein PotB (TC 3.A.1.11.1) n=1 Tax=hydrothermal vent metagenome TaxID=652676 RepID=A0A3B0T3P4_9ZZZZ
MFANRNVGILLTLPAALFIGLSFVVPVLLLISESFQSAGSWNFDNYFNFFGESLNREVFWRTMRLAVLVTLTSTVLGYACAFGIREISEKRRGLLIGLIILPLMVSPVARTYAWIVIFGRIGFVNSTIVWLGLSETPIRILFTETAVFIGLLQLFMPFMVLSLVSALENLPRDVISAARTLGASRLTIFFKIILPLTREGLVMGGTLVFTGSITAYITPAILGGSKVLMLETLLYQRVSVSNDFVSASVIAAILMTTSLVTHKLLRRLASVKRK